LTHIEGPKSLLKNVLDTLRHNRKMSGGIIGILIIVSIALSVYPLGVPVPPALGPYLPKLPPSSDHPLGTDNFGNDMLQVLLYGTQVSLYIGVITGLVGTTLAITIGFVAGYRGGLVDDVIRSIIDVFMVIPLFPILALVLVFFKGIPLLAVAILLGLFSWPGGARTIRSLVLSLRERDFVNLAKISGSSQFEILFKEIFPNTIPYMSIVFMNAIVGGMTAEVSLEVIGLGPGATNTLGYIFSFAIQNIAVLRGWWWWIVPPTAVLVWIFTSLFVITLGLDEIANPRLKRITGL